MDNSQGEDQGGSREPRSRTDELYEQLQRQAEDLRKSGYEADASRSRSVPEQSTYVTLTIRIRDEDAGKG